MDLRDSIRTIPNYPKSGIMFRDITTLLGDAAALSQAVDELATPFVGLGIGKVAGIEARGFILGGAVAHRLSAGFVPLRKKGKLPRPTLMASYQLEYGADELHMHDDAVAAGERILLIDDLIATGGTASAGIRLMERAGAEVIGCSFVIDLPDLGGAARLAAEGVSVHTLVAFEGE